VADHPQLEELVVWLHRRGAQVSVSSLRLDALSEGLVAALVASGARTLTLAPEAGSERLRRAIHKPITDAQVVAATEMLARHRVPQVKLYFMVGLPTETEADIRGIIELSLEMKGRLPGTRLSLQLSPFVPKVGTPFQGWPMAPVPRLRERQALIARALHPRGIRVRAESPEWSAVQAVLAQGDERLARAIARVPRPTLAAWRHALEAEGLDPARYLHREWAGTPPDAVEGIGDVGDCGEPGEG